MIRAPWANRIASRAVQFGWNTAAFVGLFLLWSALSAADVLSRAWFPSPLEVWDEFLEQIANGQLATNVWASLSRLGVAYVVSISLGVGVGVLLGLRRGLAEFFQPVISFFNGISGIVWLPLAILWFGQGPGTITFLVWTSMFFVIFYNTVTGVKSVPKVFESAMLTMGASRWRVVTDVLVPGALPNIVTGMRLGMGFGWRALIGAEIFAASNGLGFMIYNASEYLQASLIFVALITIGVIWLATDRVILVRLERWTIRRWGTISSQ